MKCTRTQTQTYKFIIWAEKYFSIWLATEPSVCRSSLIFVRIANPNSFHKRSKRTLIHTSYTHHIPHKYRKTETKLNTRSNFGVHV